MQRWQAVSPKQYNVRRPHLIARGLKWHGDPYGFFNAAKRLRAGEQPPFTLRKCLYLEWYSNANGRVVIQSTRLKVERIGVRAFELTEKEWEEQTRQNSEELNYFMAQLGDAIQAIEPSEE